MLSYQHGFHAGNAADVHKHVALLMLLRRLQEKPAPLCFVDCHAGRGLYDLSGDEARKTGEAEDGILRLRSARDTSGDVADYLDLVASFNPDGGCRYYPGSAALARAVLRPGDRAILMELHPQEYRALRRFVGNDRRIGVHRRDCYEGLPALIPPEVRRGLVLIDPSYELKSEFEDVVDLLGRALARWPNAVYVTWYPVLAAGRHRALLERLRKLAPAETLQSEVCFDASRAGLRGSGLVVCNAPWQFEDRFGPALRQVLEILAPVGRAMHTLCRIAAG